MTLPNPPAPLSANEFLERMKADTSGLYLLGSLNRHITVHSQQSRAINLIQALMQTESGIDGKAVAIVGAGFAGLTAAAFALEYTTAQVTLFDTSPRPLWVQERCSNRWLHPGVYDWPYRGSLEPRTLLPILNWRAAAAVDVVTQIRSEWDRIAATNNRLTLRLETKVTAVTQADGGRLSVRLDGDKQELFDIVVLAVGFGIERGGPGRAAYWNDEDGLDGIAEDSSVLVSGFGDGGLADVLRLCLPKIRQESLIELVRLVPTEIQSDLIRADRNFDGRSGSLDDFYGKLSVERVIERLANASLPKARVTLAGKGSLYDPRSAILNRFLISQLVKARGEQAFELAKGAVDVESLAELPDGRWGIKLNEAEAPREFDHVVLRLGPEAVYQDISLPSDENIWKERGKYWYDMPQSQDRTRVLFAEHRESEIELDEVQQDCLAFESSSERWCLVLHPPDASIDWAVHVGQAIERVSKQVMNLNVQPLVLCAQDVLANQVRIRSAVRALCAADIVIADVTGYDPGILFLLGIRAAVRRGVTIACTQEPLKDLWDGLPFNLKELNLVSFYDQDAGHVELSASISAGLSQSGVSTRYLDLPVYDYIREESTDEETVDHQRVLLLRAFEPYDGGRKILVQNRIREGLGFSDGAPVESVIDQISPRLAGQRLYEAIRHWNTCVVDLTWWRPNVMFELGVRLAVRPAGTFCLIDATVDGDKTFKGVRAELRDFLHPFAYNKVTRSFAKAFTARVPDTNPVYATAANHFRTRQDHFDETPDAVILATAFLTRGHIDPLQFVDLLPIYARDNLTYGKEVDHALFERLCAAWLYLAEREQPYALRPIDLLDARRLVAFRHFVRLGTRLKTGLAARFGPHDQRLHERIEETEQQARRSGAVKLDDLLAKWTSFRVEPPWGFAKAEIDDDLIEQWEEQGQELAELEMLLVQLDSPVCELLLQGVRSDQRRARVVVGQFKRRTP